PITMFNCHCRDCQRTSGGAFTPVVYVPAKAFKITKGSPRYYSTPSDMVGHNKRGFCPECGSRLFGGETEHGQGITASSLDEPSLIDPARSAVIVVDMENDFAAKGGMFDRAGVDISGAQKAIAPTAKVLAAARQAGLKIVYLKMGYRPDLSDLGASDSVNRIRLLTFGVGQKIQAPDGRESRLLIRDTWDTDIVPDLKPQPNDI